MVRDPDGTICFVEVKLRSGDLAGLPREAVDNQAAEAFVDKAFGGSLPGFLAAFMGGRKLTDREAEDLKRLIDQYKEG